MSNTNVIYAADRFGDAAFRDSILFKSWTHDRYWLGFDVAKCTRFHDAMAACNNEPPLTIATIERLERLYMAWLIQRGDEVSDRR